MGGGGMLMGSGIGRGLFGDFTTYCTGSWWMLRFVRFSGRRVRNITGCLVYGVEYCPRLAFIRCLRDIVITYRYPQPRLKRTDNRREYLHIRHKR